MDLLRDLRRRVLGGTAVAVLVPLAIVVAALGIGVGGSGGLGALSQAFRGPEVPGVEPAAARADSGGDDDPGELLADAAPAATSTPAGSGPGPAARERRPERRRPSRGDGGDGPSATPTPGSQPPPSSTPAPAPTEPPSTIRQVGDQVKEVTDDVPIAGEPAGQVVDTIVETAEQLPLPRLP